MHKVLIALGVGQVCALLGVWWVFSESGYRVFGSDQAPAALVVYAVLATAVGKAVMWALGRRDRRAGPPPRQPA